MTSKYIKVSQYAKLMGLHPLTIKDNYNKLWKNYYNDLEAKQLDNDKANEEKVAKLNEEITINIGKKYLNQNAKILISQENDQLKIEIK